MELKKAIIVLADISGYTKFLTLHTMSLLHAEKIITELMEVVIDAAGEPLELNKLEGDALLFSVHAGEDPAASAPAVLGYTLSFFEAFRERSRELTGCNNLCPCDACRQAEMLRLKIVIHYGEIAVKQVRQFEELAGEEVVLAHRLLKNSIASNEYLLMTKAFYVLSGGIEGIEVEERAEDCEGIGSVPVMVYYPDDESEPEDRQVGTVVANALRLDAYGMARVLRLRKQPDRISSRPSVQSIGLAGFLGDIVNGLTIVIKKAIR